MSYSTEIEFIKDCCNKLELQKMWAVLNYWDNVRVNWDNYDYYELTVVLKYLTDMDLNVKFFNRDLIDYIVKYWAMILKGEDNKVVYYFSKVNFIYGNNLLSKMFYYFEINKIKTNEQFLKLVDGSIKPDELILI